MARYTLLRNVTSVLADGHQGTQIPSLGNPGFHGRLRPFDAPQELPPLHEPAKGLPPFETVVKGMASDTSSLGKGVPPLTSLTKGCPLGTGTMLAKLNSVALPSCPTPRS
jgi:hypothetical protein